MRAVKFSGTYAVELLVILLHQLFTAFWISENPVLELCLDFFSLTLHDTSCIRVYYTFFLALLIQNRLIDLRVFQVQQMLRDLIGIHAVRAECFSSRHGHIRTFILDTVRSGYFRVFYLYRLCPSPQRVCTPVTFIIGRSERLIHKLLVDLRVYPCSSTQTYFYIRSFQRFRHCLFQRSYVDRKTAVCFRCFLCCIQLLPDVTR